MADDQDLSPFDDDNNATQILQALISPAPAQALVASPPDSPPPTEPGVSTPLTGSLRAAPSQAEPKRLPDLAAQPAGKAAPAKMVRRGLAGYFSSGAAARAAVSKTAPVTIGWRGAQAARADLRDPALRADVLSATNRPQPVGATDPRSGRRITQPTDNPAVNQALATDAMGEYRAGLEQAVAGIPGARLAASRGAKNPHRLAEKIALEAQPPQTVSDYGAAQISVSSPQAKDAVIAAVQKRFPVLRVKDTFAQGDPEYGYRSYSMQLQMPNGASQELQIVPKEIFQVNRAEHKKYKAARDAKLAGRSAGAIAAAAKRENDAAMARFNVRNRTSHKDTPTRAAGVQAGMADDLRKGSSVALPDGARATVLYLDPNLKIARVRTAAGKSVTVRRQDLRRWDGDSGVSALSRESNSRHDDKN